MYCVNIDRFKEDSFHIQEYLEEVYDQCTKQENVSCDFIIAELHKIKEALVYKEEEIKDKKIYFSGKERIEELGGVLSSVVLSSESLEFMRIMDDYEKIKKKGRYMEYCILAEEDALLDRIGESQSLLEISEFLQVLLDAASVAPPSKKSNTSVLGSISNVFESVIGNKPEEESPNQRKPDSKELVDEFNLSEKEGVLVSGVLLNRLNQYKKRIVSLAKTSYVDAIEKNNIDDAKKTAVLCYTLGLNTYAIDHLIKSQKPLPYSSIIVPDIDLVKESTLSDLVDYLNNVNDRVETTVYLIKDLLINNHYMMNKEENSCILSPLEMFGLIKNLLNTSFSSVISAINTIDDPVEYLITAETIISHISLLKDRICYIIPGVKPRLMKHSIVHMVEDDLLEKETESMRIIFNGLVKAVTSNKSTLKYKINGEKLTELKTPLEAVFRYMAFCHKVSNRSVKFGYSHKILELLFNFQLRGFTAILDAIFSKKYIPYLGTKLHLDTYLCIKKYYKKVCNPVNEECVSSVVNKLNQIEITRNKNISSAEMHYLISKLEAPLNAYDAQGTVSLLSESFNYLPSTPVYKVIIIETVEIFYIKIKERVYTRTSIKEVKKSLDYINILYKYSKTLKTQIDRKLKRLKDLLEGALVDESDLYRIFDLVKATNEEQKVIKRIRERIRSNSQEE
ncbi:hypothetical protein NEPAR06_0426 [Nematocida parisii]|uniref:uncharacterized protein n=1 Tax=Nematocida parisii (strain ERTm1 / ATCC PRA-289) TaxID=881290 RepID=UPI000264BBB2|nr:uncharacterized protein NEPG_01798 [Nematocida parisii ERTm1]EIJ93456.1 hypothetical protein NEPG_01798 [Nematocida parisii ERTm1]KAI5153418.1 hypothetical protein NEPAR06_0426 [Nematocida parisii]|eukprot:XP_013059626.1 hypothetical protein NEPG_01798 [Nematocida parisii ERTm1]